MRHQLATLIALTLCACGATPTGLAPDSGSHADSGFDFGTDSGNPQGDGTNDAGSMDSGGFDSGVIVPLYDAGPQGVDAGNPVVDAGTPIVDAGSPTIVDAGSPTIDGGSDLGDMVPNSAATCTSGVTWLLGNTGTDLMNPGQDCIACHTMHSNAPTYTFAGTVYPSTHEPDNCDGANGGWSIIITDATGQQITIMGNIVGSFHSTQAFTAPYTAQIVGTDGRTREMATPQTTGACNSCHTQDGLNGAPGRIVEP